MKAHYLGWTIGSGQQLLNFKLFANIFRRMDMLLAEYREHDGWQYRVWTMEDAAYGSFKVVDKPQLETIIRAFHLMGGCCRPADDSHIESVLADPQCPWCVQPGVATASLMNP
jgi:hypothetical protein